MDLNKDLLSIADKLRSVLRDMNAYEADRRIPSTAYCFVSNGLQEVITSLTNGEADGWLRENYLLDNPDESTKECIRMWAYGRERCLVCYKAGVEEWDSATGELEMQYPCHPVKVVYVSR